GFARRSANTLSGSRSHAPSNGARHTASIRTTAPRHIGRRLVITLPRRNPPVSPFHHRILMRSNLISLFCAFLFGLRVGQSRRGPPDSTRPHNEVRELPRWSKMPSAQQGRRARDLFPRDLAPETRRLRCLPL